MLRVLSQWVKGTMGKSLIDMIDPIYILKKLKYIIHLTKYDQFIFLL